MSLKKLKIKPDQKIAVVNRPAGYLNALGNLPDRGKLDSELVGRCELIHAFSTHFQELGMQIEDRKTALIDDGILWISYPKQSAKQESDLNRDILRDKLADQGLKAVAQISIEDTWSALWLKTL
jgi:hypothetical protein